MGHIRTEPDVWDLLKSAGVCLVCYHPEYDVHSTAASSSLALECHIIKLSPCHLAAIWATGTLVVPCSNVHFVWYLHLTYLSNITVSSIPESNKGLDDWTWDDIYKEYLGINSIFSGPLVTICYVLILVTMCKAVVCIMSGFVQIIIVLLPRCKQSPDIFII